MDVVVIGSGTLEAPLFWTGDAHEGIGPDAVATLMAVAEALIRGAGNRPGDRPVSTFVRVADTIYLLSVA